MLLDPGLGPAQDEEEKGELVGMEETNEVEDSNLRGFLAFCVFLLDARLMTRVDTFVDSINDDEPFGHSVEIGETLKRLDDELHELMLKRHLHETDSLCFDCGFDVGSKLWDRSSELVGEGDYETGWGVPL